MINKKSGGGVGFVILVVALVVVMLLAAKAWNAMLPTAVQILKPAAAGGVPDHGQKEVGDMIRSGTLPNLKQMNQNTDQHIQQMKDGAKGQD